MIRWKFVLCLRPRWFDFSMSWAAAKSGAQSLIASVGYVKNFNVGCEVLTEKNPPRLCIVHHLAPQMTDGDMRFLDPRGPAGRHDYR